MKKDKLKKAVSDVFDQSGNPLNPLVDRLVQYACHVITKEDEKSVDLPKLKQMIQVVKDLKDLSKAEDAAADIGKLEALIRGWIAS